MKILHAGIFDDHDLGGDIIFKKGFENNGCEVVTFDFRARAAADGQEAMERRLVESARDTDMLFVGKGDGFRPDTFAEIRRHGVLAALWYGDIRPQPERWLLDLLGEIDCFFMSSGGWELARYFKQGKPGRAAYFFPPVDPDLVKKYAHVASNTRDVVFTGTAHAIADRGRQDVISYLRQRGDVKFYGGAEYGRGLPGKAMRFLRELAGKSSYVRGEAYVAAIKSARIGVGANAIEGVPRYTSDRLAHFLTFGTFYLAAHFPEIERLFNEGEELTWFRDIADLDAKIDYYLHEDAAREAIAAAGQAKALRDYNCTEIAAMMLDIVRTGRSNRFPWVEVLD